MSTERLFGGVDRVFGDFVSFLMILGVKVGDFPPPWGGEELQILKHKALLGR